MELAKSGACESALETGCSAGRPHLAPTTAWAAAEFMHARSDATSVRRSGHRVNEDPCSYEDPGAASRSREANTERQMDDKHPALPWE